MSTPLLLIAAIIALAFVYVLLPSAADVYRRFSGKIVARCPETEKPAIVRIDAVHAATTDLFGNPELRVAGCSNWPERAGCAERCLAAVAGSPVASRLERIVARWADGKPCALCDQPLDDPSSGFGPQPWIDEERVTHDWSESPDDALVLESLFAVRPVCWECHLLAVRSKDADLRTGETAGERES
jgi:hypothetical protein